MALAFWAVLQLLGHGLSYHYGYIQFPFHFTFSFPLDSPLPTLGGSGGSGDQNLRKLLE